MDTNDFEKIYKEYYTRIYAYIKKKISHTQDAEELAGDIFTSFYQNLDKYDADLCGINTWLFVITKNRLKNYYRDRKVQVSLEEVDEQYAVEESLPESVLIMEQNRRELFESLKLLSARERSIIIKKYYEDKKYSEIAEELGITPGNVRVILKRSMGKLKKIMEN